MKNILRKLLILLTALSLVLALASCGVIKPIEKPEPPSVDPENPENPENPGEPEADPVVVFCERLEGFTAKKYKTVELKVTTVTGRVTLVSVYTLTGKTVNYSVEKLASFVVGEDGTVTIPTEHKQTVVGSATFSASSDDVLFDGALVTIPDYRILTGSFTFEVDNMENYLAGDGIDTFDVIDAARFLSLDAAIEDLAASVVYTEQALSSITLTYLQGNSEVTLEYAYGEALAD